MDFPVRYVKLDLWFDIPTFLPSKGWNPLTFVSARRYWSTSGSLLGFNYLALELNYPLVIPGLHDVTWVFLKILHMCLKYIPQAPDVRSSKDNYG
jgi:hypothetical protein